MIRETLYGGEQSPDEIFFRGMLFKIFNRIDTWEALGARVGHVSWRDYSFERYASALDQMLATGSGIYSGAYIMPSPAFGHIRKHRNHLGLLEHMMRTEAPKRIADAPSLEAVYRILLGYPSLGPFLAYQFTIDLNYSTLCNFSEMDFVVAGPGARDGIRKCFSDTGGLSDADVIRAVTARADDEFARLGLHFQDLWGRKLQLIDCQNLFCEVDKYARVMHPEFSGVSGRTRIKQKFVPTKRPCPQWYPPKWDLRVPVVRDSDVSDRNEPARRGAVGQLSLGLA
jgi:5-hmdU DNA kinase-like protein